MKVLTFCNIVPGRWGAFEDLLVAIGRLCIETRDEMLVVLGGEPVRDVAQRFSDEGLRWDVMKGWDRGQEDVDPWRFCRGALSFVRRERPEVAAVHFGDELPASVAILLSRMYMGHSTKWIWYQRQQIRPPNAVTRRISRLRIASCFFDHFVACSESGRSALVARGVDREDTSVIHTAIGPYEPKKEKGWLRDELGVARDSVLVASVGSLIPRKRTHVSVSVFAKAQEMTKTDAHLLIVGSGPEEMSLRDQIDRAAMGDRIHLLGSRSDVRDILSDCDILVHSSRAEGCANVVNEAMSVSLPVVMTDAGAAREQIDDGVSGFVVGREDERALVERLVTLMQDDELRIKYGREAKKRWQGMFQLSVAAAAHHHLYRTIAERGRNRR